MAENQEYEMGNGEFAQDGAGEDYTQDDQMNGTTNENTGEAGDSGSAEAPGRDDDRYVIFCCFYTFKEQNVLHKHLNIISLVLNNIKCAF